MGLSVTAVPASTAPRMAAPTEVADRTPMTTATTAAIETRREATDPDRGQSLDVLA